ncbi:hypothetical protein [Vibrio campbellii]|uniref:hypothetical protein n=1 Tax=Vibrio campbellii TaxID=680 RepID=UPI0005F09644|nr:hypothetical protein [Vibrio campbellii]
MDYIATYFYQEGKNSGSTYANINLDIESRTLVYWKTVYVFYFTSTTFNSEKKHVFFTNVDDFPFRKEIEGLGVKVYSDLVLTRNNVGKWASVKFFFDVLEYINNSSFFNPNDKFMLFDTDCIAIRTMNGKVFDRISPENKFLAYLNGSVNSDINFHGSKLSSIIDVYLNAFDTKVDITEKIGGEYFGFSKCSLSELIEKYTKLFNLDSGNILITEEQVLTLFHADLKFDLSHAAVCRVWTTLKDNNIPNNIDSYFYLHLPAEKQLSLEQIFNATIEHQSLDKVELEKIIVSKTKLWSRNKLILRRIVWTLKRKIGLI